MEAWRYVVVVIGSLIALISIIPYLVEVVRGKTKPRIVSWFVWFVLTGVGCAAAFVDGQYFTAILLFMSALETLAIVILGWKLGDRHFESLEIVCLIGAIVGIVLWQIFNSPAIGALAAVILDLVAGVPTLIHIWKKPQEETWQTFLLSFLAAAFTLFVLTDWRITASAYPIYLVVINLTFVVFILSRRRVLKLNKVVK